jgi:hypothetical protein
MKIIARYDKFSHPPELILYIHGAPHKRQHRAVLQMYREELYAAAVRGIGSEVDMPIDHAIDLKVLFTNPASPDLDHLLEALYMGLDQKTLKGPAVLKDDRHIQHVSMGKFYPNEQTKRDSQR